MIHYTLVWGENKDMPYRSRLHIQAEILETAATKTSKTRIMYRVALSYFQVSSYLRDLIEMGLLQYDEYDARYNTTSKGRDFLLSFKQLATLIE